MRTKLKICGITTLSDAIVCSESGVDWLGFNFFKESPRYISAEDAGKIIAQLNNSVKTAAILVRPTRDQIIEIINVIDIDILQIYDPLDFKDLSIFNLKSIICYRINPQNPAAEYPMMNADMILFDSYAKDVLGGSGKKFNWNLIPDSLSRDKLVLAGGITPQNITQALKAVNPAVIDVASGAEKSPGIKDLEKIKKMVSEIKKYNNRLD